MAIKKVYKVSFKGVIFPGFDKEQVIENVHNITRIPKHTITRKFFSGKTVVIRHADSQEYAGRLQKTFAQAGIETYINEISREAVQDEALVSDAAVFDIIETENASEKEPVESGKIPLTKKIFALITVILFSVITLYFLNNSSIVQVEDSNLQVEDSNLQVEDSDLQAEDSDLQAEGYNLNPTQKSKQTIPEDLLPVFLTAKQVRILIKITDKSELKRLSQFISLLDIKSAYLDIINQKINSKHTDLSISDEYPLYVFKLREQDNKAEAQTGVILSTKNKLPQTFISQFQKEFDNNLKNNSLIDSCVKTLKVKMINTDNHLLLTTIGDSQTLQHFKNLSEQKQLKARLLQLDKLFHQSDNSKNAAFNLFYLNQFAENKSTKYLKHSNHIALSANNDSFWLSLDKSLSTKNREVLKQFNINTNDENKLSSLKINNLFDLILLFVSQSYSDNFFINTPTDPIFEQEQIIKLKNNYSVRDIKPYDNELDIELLAQWQSGPFALSTNRFKFDNNLVIELLAKGQNIHNLMEYSHSALLRIDSVFNKKNENILSQDCSVQSGFGGSHTDQNYSKSYFRDLDGEQEAYINDDFKTYHTITAKKDIKIKPGYNNNDIDVLKGEIILQLPEQIQQKSITIQKYTHHTQFENFSLLLRHHPETKSLQYGITGKTNHFITLRAYNSSGAVIDTLSLNKKSLIDENISIYKQEYSEPIESVKVFYTKENKVINYPFAFKPEILPGTTSSADTIATQQSSKESQPIPFSQGKLDLNPLKKEVQFDNPAWLGKKWPGNEISRNTALPFYVNLFIHENNKDSSDNMHKLDAVLNIKSSLSPFISQNITAVKLTLLEDNKILLDNFIAFNTNDFLGGENEPDISEDGQIKPPQISSYLNANSAFEITKDLLLKNNQRIHGRIILSLPKRFKIHSKKYVSLGQLIQSDGMLIKSVELNKHQIQFEISGAIKNLVQLKLYNKKNNLISEPFEFKHIENNKALLTLLYNDQIDTVKLVLSQDSIIKEYPFSFHK